MGKILNALKTANGDIPELVRQCLDEPGRRASSAGVPETRAGSRRSSGAGVVEPIFEKSPVVRLTQWDEKMDGFEPVQEGWRDDAEIPLLPALADARRESGVRPVSLKISDSAPLLSAGIEDRRAAEQYRIIRTRIFQQLPQHSITVISSPCAGDGKTVTALNLAAALALKCEDRVLFVDADLRLSKVAECLGITATPGLAEVLSGRCDLEDAMLRVEQLPNFYILPAGHAAANPSELFDSSSWKTLVARFREEFQRTIIDCPPVEAVADYDLIASSCDGLVLVVRPDHTSRPALTSALAKVKSKLTGILINEAEDWFLWKRSSSSYYYYQKDSRPGQGRKAAK